MSNAATHAETRIANLESLRDAARANQDRMMAAFAKAANGNLDNAIIRQLADRAEEWRRKADRAHGEILRLRGR